MVVIEFAGNTLRTRFCGKKLNFVHQGTAPCLIDPSAEFALQTFELFLPRLSVGNDYQTAALAP